MENNKKDRTQLKSYFKSNAVPTEQNFKDFIDAGLNQKEDGIAKIPNGALAIQSASATEELIHFYKSFDDANPTWKLNQKPTDKAGFNISDGTSKSRLFIEASTGNVGLSNTAPVARLDVNANDANGLLIRGGNSAAATANSQLTFGYNGTAQYRHALKTRHNAGAPAGNAMDFFLWKQGTDGIDALGTLQVMTLDGNGNVGINNSAPAAKLDVNTNDVNGVLIRGGNGATTYATNQMTFGYNGTALHRHAIKTRHHGGQKANNAIDFFVWNQGTDTNETAGTQQVMTLDGFQGGAVGIGTTTPSARLHIIPSANGPANNGVYVYNDLGYSGVKDAILAARVKGTTAGNPYISMDVDGVGGWSMGLDNADAQSFKISSAWNTFSDATRLTIDRNSGNVGIGRRPKASGAVKLDLPRETIIGTTDGDADEHAVSNRGTKVSFGAVTAEFAGMSVVVKEGTNGCGNSSDVTFSTWECNTSVTREVARFTGRGYMGINTSKPRWPLHVVGAASTGTISGNGAAMDVDRYNNSWDNGVSAHLSILAEDAIGTRTFFCCHQQILTGSDARIKNVIGRSDAQADLDILMQIPIKEYSHIDTGRHGNHISKKVIAQDVEAVFPQAIRQRIETIPDIYANAVSTDFDTERSLLTIEMEKAPDLSVGDLVELVGSEAKGHYEVTAVNGKHFTVKADTDPGSVFVFGKEVPDFRFVDYDALSMLGISSIQALSQQVNLLKDEVSSLKKALSAYSA